MREKGNSGILQVKQRPVSKMTDPLQLLSENAHCTGQRNPTQGLGTGLGRKYSQRSGQAYGKSHFLWLNSEADSLPDPQANHSLC